MSPGQGQAGSTGRSHRLGRQHTLHGGLGERNAFGRSATTDRHDLTLFVVADGIAEEPLEHVIVDHHDGQDGRRECQGVHADAQKNDPSLPAARASPSAR